MATIQAEVSKHHKKKDGSIPVKIRVTHKRKMRRLPTNLVAYPEDLTRDYKIKRDSNLFFQCQALVKGMYDALSDVSYFDMQEKDVDFVVAHIESKLKEKDWRLDFFSFADSFLETSRITDSTKRTYTVALSALERFVGERVLDINAIDVPFLMRFEEFLANEPKFYFSKKLKKTVATKKEKRRGAGGHAYFNKLATVFKAARLLYNDDDLGVVRIPRTPFEKVRVKAAPGVGEEPLPLEVVRRMINEKREGIPEAQRRALDISLLSLGLMGANMADLYEAVPPDKKGVWTYERKKTRTRRADRAEMKVLVPACVAEYVKCLSAGAERGRWLNLSRRFASANGATQATNAGLKEWAKENGLPAFTFYAVRKTWATVARSKDCGIEKATVDECLCHVGDYRMADTYIRRDWTVLWEANNKVVKLIWGID